MEAMKSCITVLMPIYRGVEFFAEALASLRAQTCRNWRLLVGINGLPRCSTTWELLYLYRDDHVRLLDLGDVGGKAGALNRMVQCVTTDWVALLDVDDLWEPSKLARQIPYMQRFDVIGTQCSYFGERSGSPHIPLGKVPGEWFINDNPIDNSSAIMHRENACWDEEFNAGLEDYELWSRLNAQGKTFYNVSASLVRHRIHRASHFNTRPHDEAYAKIRERYHL
jgi:glycosyltransferase involved in cell wall biosynthesis